MISPAVLPEELAALGRHNFVPLSDDYCPRRPGGG
jgi:hypothetical protein